MNAPTTTTTTATTTTRFVVRLALNSLVQSSFSASTSPSASLDFLQACSSVSLLPLGLLRGLEFRRWRLSWFSRLLFWVGAEQLQLRNLSPLQGGAISPRNAKSKDGGFRPGFDPLQGRKIQERIWSKGEGGEVRGMGLERGLRFLRISDHEKRALWAKKFRQLECRFELRFFYLNFFFSGQQPS